MRNTQLDWLATQVKDASFPLVLGDLNTTPWNHAFKRFISRGGLKNSSPTWTGTWPAHFFPLRIPLDHCLTSKGLSVRSKEIGPAIGSDHAPILVQLAW